MLSLQSLSIHSDAMSLFALITALLLEQFKPFPLRRRLYGGLTDYVRYFRHHFNAGEYSHGRAAWSLAVMPGVVVMALTFHLLNSIHPVFSWSLNVLALYLSLGFVQSSHALNAVGQALRNGRLAEARDLLSGWRGVSCHELNTDEVVRVAIEETLLAAHRHLFGVVTWFVLFSLFGLGGAAGALLYCLAEVVSAHVSEEAGEDEFGAEEFGRFARTMFYLLEWLPIRLTALTFAIVGNFEDTVYCWRSQAASWPDGEKGVLFASGAGALGVRLGLPIPQEGAVLHRPELGIGGKADVLSMQYTVRLVWRAAIFMLFMLFMLSLAGLLR